MSATYTAAIEAMRAELADARRTHDGHADSVALRVLCLLDRAGLTAAERKRLAAYAELLGDAPVTPVPP